MLLSDAVSRGDAMYLVRTNALLAHITHTLDVDETSLEALSRHSKQNTASFFTTNEKKGNQ